VRGYLTSEHGKGDIVLSLARCLTRVAADAPVEIYQHSVSLLALGHILIYPKGIEK